MLQLPFAVPMRIALVLTLLSSSLHAAGHLNTATPPVEAPEMLDPYDIELIIFERPGEATQENWPQQPGVPNLSEAMAALLEGKGNASKRRLSNVSKLGKIPDPIQVSEGIERKLDGAAYTLKRKGMRLVLHKLWRQDIKDRDTPAWLSVESGRVNGLVQISKGRFLHIETDLLVGKMPEPDTALTPARPIAFNAAPSAAVPTASFDTQGQQTDLPEVAPVYRVQMHRRMRSDELHYLDHPKLGILVIAQRFKPETPELIEEAPVREEVPAEPEEPVNTAPADGLPRALPDPT